MISTLVRTTLAFILSATLLAAVDLKALAGPGAILHTQRPIDLHALWLRLTVADFEKNGNHDPTWDLDLTRLLTRMAVLQSYVPEPPGTMGKSEALSVAQRLGKIGACREPLAAWALFMLIKDDPAERDAAFQTAQLAFAEFTADEHFRHLARPNNLLQMQVLVWLLGQCGPNASAEEHASGSRYATDLGAALKRSLIQRECAGFPALWLSTLDELQLHDKLYGESVRTDVDSLALIDHLDPWIVNGLRGLVRTKNAWAWRGSGWASSVTAEGNAGFERNLSEADALLTEAWKANPKDPLVPAYACTVAGAGFSKTAVETWILRAKTACFDHPLAITKAVTFMLPRWGGSYEKILDLGCDCVDTGRYDTSVPGVFFEMVRLGYADSKDMDSRSDFAAALMRPRVRAAVEAWYAGYSAKFPDAIPQLSCQRAVIYSLQERMPEARKALENVPPAKLDTAMAAFYGVDLRALQAATASAHQIP